MNLVVLGTNTSTTWMMVNALMSDYPDIHVVIEKPISRFVFLKRRVARLGLMNVFGQLLFILYSTFMQRLSQKYVKKLLEFSGLSSVPRQDIPITYFDSVNSQECINWLSQKCPSVIVLNGTRIVSSALLASTSAKILNTHCGITPAYRGVHGGYWALVNGDTDNLGVTVHLVDAGIDTGGIVFQDKIEIEETDNFSTYPVKQYIVGIPIMKQAIDNALCGCLSTYERTDLKSAIWHHPTLWQYLWVRFSRGVR